MPVPVGASAVEAIPAARALAEAPAALASRELLGCTTSMSSSETCCTDGAAPATVADMVVRSTDRKPPVMPLPATSVTPKDLKQ